MKTRVDGIVYDLPEEVVEKLHLRRYRDRRRKSSVISIRFTNQELEDLENRFLSADTFLSFSVWLHDLIFLSLQQEVNKSAGYFGFMRGKRRLR